MAAADPPKIRRGEPVALALGAGGALGFAEIGVIEALQARGLKIVTVAGSSSGALVGGVFAAGKLAEFSEKLKEMSRADFVRMLDPSLEGNGLFHGERLIEHMREVVGDPDIESLPITFVATWPLKTTIGMLSICAVASGVTQLVAAGPLVTMHTPGLPVAR